MLISQKKSIKKLERRSLVKHYFTRTQVKKKEDVKNEMESARRIQHRKVQKDEKEMFAVKERRSGETCKQ